MALRLWREGDVWVALTDSPDDRFPAKEAGFRWCAPWDEGRKRWTTRDAEAALRLREYAVDPDVVAALDALAAERHAAVAASRATDADVDLPAPDGLEYLPYQRAGIVYALARDATLFGDEMGLGKTIQALGAVNADPHAHRILVVCPASLKLNWAREAERWLCRPTRIEVWDSKGCVRVSGQSMDPHADLLVAVNYDVLVRVRDELRREPWDVLVCDEAHYLKNPKALRTIEVLGRNLRRSVVALTMAKRMPGGYSADALAAAERKLTEEHGNTQWIPSPPALPARRRLFLTGTPILNRPMEFWTLAHALAPDTFRSWQQYASRYCAASQGRFGQDATGASNLGELQAKARAAFMVRRLKADVLKELPPKRRQVIELPANGSQRYVDAERSAWRAHEDAIGELRARVELAKVAEDEAEYRSAVDALRSGVSAAFTQLAKLRHETALAKLPLVLAHVREALDEGGKLVVFAHHRDVVATLRDELEDAAPAVVTGETPVMGRQAEVDRFQQDPGCRVFLGNLKAAGVGLTLTAAAHVVFAELDWVPGNLTQAEDRCHRIGQTAESVLVQHLVLEGSLDAEMAQRVVAKQRVLELALDARDADAHAVPAALEVAIPVVPGEARNAAAAADATRDQLGEEAAALTDAQVAAAHTGVRMLAGRCDGAQRLDAAGFSMIDTRVGHDLAARDTLTRRQAALARRLCRKYRRQLPHELVALLGVDAKEERK